MRLAVVTYLFTTVSFLALDTVWLSVTGPSLYKVRLAGLLLDKPHLSVAAGFYLMYAFALVVFAIRPALLAMNGWHALWAGALLGLTAYGSYDLTNQATLVGWSTRVTIFDMAWGTFASAVASLIGFAATRFVVAHSILKP